MLVHHFLEYYARNTPELPCLTLGENTYGYGEVNTLSNQIAHGPVGTGNISRAKNRDSGRE